MLILGLKSKFDRQNTILSHCRHSRTFWGVPVAARPCENIENMKGKQTSHTAAAKCSFGASKEVSLQKHNTFGGAKPLQIHRETPNVYRDPSPLCSRLLIFKMACPQLLQIALKTHMVYRHPAHLCSQMLILGHKSKFDR